jgi:hypothetical protein
MRTRAARSDATRVRRREQSQRRREANPALSVIDINRTKGATEIPTVMKFMLIDVLPADRTAVKLT